ncbi:helix-turn-helix domain-containing protein [Thalassorhabdus alkalitolerans]
MHSLAVKLYKESNHTVSEICKITSVPRSSFYRRFNSEKINIL